MFGQLLAKQILFCQGHLWVPRGIGVGVVAGLGLGICEERSESLAKIHVRRQWSEERMEQVKREVISDKKSEQINAD